MEFNRKHLIYFIIPFIIVVAMVVLQPLENDAAGRAIDLNKKCLFKSATKLCQFNGTDYSFTCSCGSAGEVKGRAPNCVDVDCDAICEESLCSKE